MKKMLFYIAIFFAILSVGQKAKAVDNVPPTVPQNLGYLYTTDNSIRLTWQASSDFLDGPNISYVVYKNGASVATASEIPYTLTGLDPHTIYTFTVAAKDSSGNISEQSNVITATTQYDNVPPVVSIISPINNAVLQNIVEFTASSSDDVLVDRVQYTLDGGLLGDAVKVSPYKFNFDASKYIKNSKHTLSAIAYDASGNAGAAQTINFTTGSQPAPTPYGISVGQITYSSAVITWQTSVGTLGSINYGTGSSLGSIIKEQSATTAHTFALSNLQSGQIYYFSAMADLSGYATASSSQMSFTTLSANNNMGGDTTAPWVNINSPTQDSELSGIFILKVSADDAYATSTQAKSGLRAVWATVDGASLGNEYTFEPFNFSINSQNFSNGSHTIKVFAQDNAGNTAQAQIILTFNNQVSLGGVHPNGTLVLDGSTVYLIKDGQKAPFRDSEEYKSHGYNFSQATNVSLEDKALPTSPVIIKALEGSLVLDKSDHKTVYMVGSNTTKRGFASEEAFKGLGYKFQDLLEINMSDYASGPAIDSATSAHPDGALVLEGQTVWWIRSGNRLGFESAEVFNTYGFSFTKVVPANPADLGLPVGSLVKFRDGTLVLDGGSYYIISDGKKLKFSSADNLSQKGYKLSNVINASLVNYPDGGVVN